MPPRLKTSHCANTGGAPILHADSDDVAHVDTNTVDINSVDATTDAVIISNINVTNLPGQIVDNDNWNFVSTKAQRKAVVAQNKNNVAQNKNDNNNNKVTPIQLDKADSHRMGQLAANLTAIFRGNDIFLRQFGGGQNPRIFCATEAIKANVVQILTDNGFQFNSYNNSGTRRAAFIIRGLCYQSHQEAFSAIQHAIVALNIPGQIDIGLFRTPHRQYQPTKFDTPLYKVVVDGNIDERILLDVRTPNHRIFRCSRGKTKAVRGGPMPPLPALTSHCRPMPLRFQMRPMHCLT